MFAIIAAAVAFAPQPSPAVLPGELPPPFLLEPAAGVRPKDQIVVFLHGTPQVINGHWVDMNSNPVLGSLSLLETASHLGYHVLGLDYHALLNSSSETAAWCAEHGKPSCLFDSQMQVCVGGLEDDGTPTYWDAKHADGSYQAPLSREQAAMGRIRTRIAAAGWAQHYLDEDGEVRWERVIMAGHSQGASHAAFIPLYLLSGLAGPEVAVAKLAVLSGPKKDGGQWVTDPAASLGPAASWSKLRISALAAPDEHGFEEPGGAGWGGNLAAMGLEPLEIFSAEAGDGTLTTPAVPPDAAGTALLTRVQPHLATVGGDPWHYSTALSGWTPRRGGPHACGLGAAIGSAAAAVIPAAIATNKALTCDGEADRCPVCGWSDMLFSQQVWPRLLG